MRLAGVPETLGWSSGACGLALSPAADRILINDDLTVMATILTVDDSPSVRQMIKIVLGLGARAVSRPETARRGSPRPRPRASTSYNTDLNMPVIERHADDQALRALPSFVGVPIVFLTTESDDAVKHKPRRPARRAG